MYKMRGINLKTYRSTKKIQRQKGRSISKEPAVAKKTLTRAQKELLAGKIQDGHDENINKSFVGKANPIYLTITAIVLIALFFAYIAWVVSTSS
ncbi:MAG: hypothetical protein OXU27_15615 [Candidatus Poribacteria bacterium]|nr:hypothetical protein [Candidatus Poribacteria bacterium]MDE0323782.1 hypothetical protein [Candidatus Poribacteria bacterium]